MDLDDEDLIEIGIPLPKILHDEVPKKPTSFHEQGVLDAKGRAQRFHGAFTGGFSAGYFNSVGSKEGWKPAPFVSSRSQRGESSQQRPEDFMDTDDVGEHGIAPRNVATTDNFTAEEVAKQRKRKLLPSSKGIILGEEILQDLIVPTTQPMGMHLLRRLGWKDGQGVGPRIQRRALHKIKSVAAPGVKVYGCAPPPTGSDPDSYVSPVYGCALPPTGSDPTGRDPDSDESEDEYAQGLMFAPKDHTLISFKPKNNRMGLGYSGINPRSALSGRDVFDLPPPAGPRSRRGMHGQAFGVGAMNEDDGDIYATDSMKNYDISLGDPEPDDLHGWTAPNKKVAIRKIPVGYIGLLLDGFKMTDQKCQPTKIYIPPHISHGYHPFHTFPNSAAKPSNAGSSQKKLDARGRAEALGEKPEFRSVFDLVPDKDRAKLGAAIKPSSANFSQQDQPLAAPHQSQQSTAASQRDAPSSQGRGEGTDGGGAAAIPPSPMSVDDVQSMRQASTPLFHSPAAFKPFLNNPPKQARYEKFQALVKQGKSVAEALEEVADQHQTEWERNHEREEFVRANQLFKPMSSLMAARFMPASESDKGPEEVVQSDAAKAAEMKMFGKLTREKFEWHPENTLCKRFNIPNPYPNCDIVGVPQVKRDKFSVFNLFNVPSNPAPVSPLSPPRALPAPPAQAEAKPKVKLLANIGTACETSPSLPSQKSHTELPNTSSGSREEPAQQIEDPDLEEKRPPMDLFKAIFDNSDSEGSSDEEEENNKAPSKNLSEGKSLYSTGTQEQGTMPAGDLSQGTSHVGSVTSSATAEVVSSRASTRWSQLQPPGSHTHVCIKEGIADPEIVLELFSSEDEVDRKVKKEHRKHKARHKDMKKKGKHKKKKHKKEKFTGSKSSKKSKKSKKSKLKSSSSGSDEDTESYVCGSEDEILSSNTDLLQKLKNLPSGSRK